MTVVAKFASLPNAVVNSDKVSNAVPAPLTKSLLAWAIADETLDADHTTEVEELVSLIVIVFPERESIEVFNSLIAAISEVFLRCS